MQARLRLSAETVRVVAARLRTGIQGRAVSAGRRAPADANAAHARPTTRMRPAPAAREERVPPQRGDEQRRVRMAAEQRETG